MPALMPTEFSAKIVWLGIVRDREATLRAEPVEEVFAGFGGVVGEAHGGETRRSCSRVRSQYADGTQIRNTRQFSIISAEELAKMPADMGVSAFDPAWIGASMGIKGIPDFTHIPPNARLQSESGATLTIDMANRPCHLPVKVINEDAPDKGRAFKTAAKDKRGVTAWVEREGVFRVGDTLRLHIPDQRAWAHVDAARGA